MVIGKTTKHMGMEFTPIKMVRSIRDTGKKTNNMEKDLRHGLMELVMKAIMLMGGNMDRENSLGLTEALILEILLKITLMDMVTIDYA